jgi:steroid delta-isomerase-like uncharacterized protein
MRRRQLSIIAGGCAVLALAFTMWSWRGDDDSAGVIDQYLAAWNRHDAVGAASYLSPDVVYFDASVGTSLKGRDGVRENFIQTFMSAVPDSKWELIEKPLAQGKMVFFRWRFSGTNTGEWQNGTPPTGKAFSFEGHSSAEVVNGQIVREVDYYDPAAIFGPALK